MTTAPLPFWTPDDGDERQLRVFISHRFGDDQALYDEVVAALYKEGFSVQDISLSAGKLMSGPRGGALSKLKIQAQIAARIYTSDVVIAPSRPAITRSEWVTWEVQLAAIGYGIPVLFVNLRNQQLRAGLVSQIDELKLKYRVCEPTTHDIVRSIAELVDGRPTWTMRSEETDPKFRFRGPPESVRNDVLRHLPFNPRLPSPPEPLQRAKRGLWSWFSGGDRPT